MTLLWYFCIISCLFPTRFVLASQGNKMAYFYSNIYDSKLKINVNNSKMAHRHGDVRDVQHRKLTSKHHDVT